MVWWWAEKHALLKEEQPQQTEVDEVPMEQNQKDETEMVAETIQELYSVVVVVSAIFPCSTIIGPEISNDSSICKNHIHHRLPLVWTDKYSEIVVEQQR